MGPIYRIYQEFLYSTKDLFYVEGPATKEQLKAWLIKAMSQKYRQGYTCDEGGEQVSFEEICRQIVEVEDLSDEFTITMMRVPFYGSTGDPETFEVTTTPTGMTETVTLRAELIPRPYGYNPDTIPIYPINPGEK